MSRESELLKFADTCDLEIHQRVRSRRHPELTGAIKCFEWNEPGVLSAIPYNVAWDDPRACVRRARDVRALPDRQDHRGDLWRCLTSPRTATTRGAPAETYVDAAAVRRLVLAVDGLVRTEAVTRVDARLGHAIEFSNQPGCHAAECDEEHAALAEALAGALAFECANCHRPLFDHCDVHLIPCCPGKCPGRRPTERSSTAWPQTSTA